MLSIDGTTVHCTISNYNEGLMCVCVSPSTEARGVRSPEVRFTASCEPFNVGRFWKLNLDPLEQQYALLITELVLRSLCSPFLWM